MRVPAELKKADQPVSKAQWLIGRIGDPEQASTYLKIIISIALLCGFVLSWRLWISSHRLFPLSPVSDSLPEVPFPIDFVWFCGLLSLLLAIIVVARPRKLMFAFLTAAGLLSLWDQNRWQPWFYQYFFLLATLPFLAWRQEPNKADQAALNVCRAILVSTYFWSGLQKLNANFIKETWPDMASGLFRHLPESAKKIPPSLFLIIPFLELAIALGLLTRKYRRASVILAIGTHVVVLIVLVSSRENLVVWPWNVAMILIVVVLFWQNQADGLRQIVVPRTFLHALILLLFGFLPALSFLDLWDSYLSAALYSGNADQAVIYVTPPVIDQLPEPIHEHIWQVTKPFFLDINRWSYGELNVPAYPEPRLYRKVTQTICTYAEHSPDVRLRIKGKPDLLTGHRNSEYYDCDHVE